MLVSNPKKQKLSIQVKDALGFADLPIGRGEVCIMYFCTMPKVFGDVLFLSLLISFIYHSQSTVHRYYN
jgi:hypothetical protein